MPFDLVLDFGSEREKARLWGYLKTLEGKHRVEVCKYRKRRSDKANAYYWAVVLPAAARGLTDSQGESYDIEEAHEFFKAQFLSRPVVDRKTGELLGNAPGSSAVLDTARFAEYLDQVIQWCGEYLGVIVPPPSAFEIQQPATAGGK